MIRELTTQEKFKDIKMIAHNLTLSDLLGNRPTYLHYRLDKIISICNEQIGEVDEIVDAHARDHEEEENKQKELLWQRK